MQSPFLTFFWLILVVIYPANIPSLSARVPFMKTEVPHQKGNLCNIYKCIPVFSNKAYFRLVCDINSNKCATQGLCITRQSNVSTTHGDAQHTDTHSVSQTLPQIIGYCFTLMLRRPIYSGTILYTLTSVTSSMCVFKTILHQHPGFQVWGKLGKRWNGCPATIESIKVPTIQN